MAHSSKRFVFKLPWIVLGGVATALSILLEVLQVGGWINETAPWVLWPLVAVLVVIIVLLIARIDALGQERRGTARELAESQAAVAKAEGACIAAKVRVSELEKELQDQSQLSEVDRELARRLYEFSSDPETLDMLFSFFPYRIPPAPVSKMEALADLPQTRSAFNEQLSHHLTTLAETATSWLTKLQRIVATDGDYYTTKLDRHVTQKAYEEHAARTNELGSAGFELHDRMLEYQRYYASLQA